MVTETKRTPYRYSVLARFNEKLYDGLLRSNHIIEELCIDDENFWELRKGKTRYLLESKDEQGNKNIKKLPIKVIETEEFAYRGKVFYLIRRFGTVKVDEKRTMSFRTLINTICNYEHTQKTDHLLGKLIITAGVLGRTNVRISSPPGFGKDSYVKVLGYLLGNSTVIENPTMAKLEYLLYNKLIMLNEMVGLTTQEKRDIQNFLRNTGEFSNKYVKRSRATAGGEEEYDISRLSLLIAYNNLECYMNKEEFFDRSYDEAVLHRFLPFKLDGYLQTSQFLGGDNIDEASKQYAEEFLQVIRALRYYSIEKNVMSEIKKYDVTFNFIEGMTSRQQVSMIEIAKFVNLYSEDAEEYESLMRELRKRYDDYQAMINKKDFEQYNLKDIEERVI